MDARLVIALAALLPLACRRAPPVAPPVAPPAAPPAAPTPPLDAGTTAPPDAPPDVALVGAQPTTEPPLPDTEPMDPGCLAWSPRRHLAACLVGRSGSNLNADTVWQVAFLGETDEPAVSLVPLTDAGYFDDPHTVATPPGVRARLRARFVTDSFVDLRPLRRQLSAEPFEWAPGATVRVVHRRTFGGGENAAERFTERVELRWQPGGPRLTLTAWEDRPVAEPRIRAYVIPGGRYLVLDAVGAYGDEGEYGVHSLAWRCDREARTCR